MPTPDTVRSQPSLGGTHYSHPQFFSYLGSRCNQIYGHLSPQLTGQGFTPGSDHSGGENGPGTPPDSKLSHPIRQAARLFGRGAFSHTPRLHPPVSRAHGCCREGLKFRAPAVRIGGRNSSRPYPRKYGRMPNHEAYARTRRGNLRGIPVGGHSCLKRTYSRYPAVHPGSHGERTTSPGHR